MLDENGGSDNDDGRHDENRSYLQDQPSLMITMMDDDDDDDGDAG